MFIISDYDLYPKSDVNRFNQRRTGMFNQLVCIEGGLWTGMTIRQKILLSGRQRCLQ